MVGKRRRRLLLFRGSGGGWIVNLFCMLKKYNILVVEMESHQFAKAIVDCGLVFFF